MLREKVPEARGAFGRFSKEPWAQMATNREAVLCVDVPVVVAIRVVGSRGDTHTHTATDTCISKGQNIRGAAGLLSRGPLG